MNKTMKAFVAEAPKKWGIKEVPIPEPKENEVLIKMETSGICHTDLHAANFDWPVEPKYPLIPGHEGIGKIEKLGPGVTKWKIGDRVALAWLHDTCGECEFCLTGKETLCANQNMTAYTKDGSFAEYAIGNANFIVEVPKKLDIISGAPVVCAGVTTYKAIKRTEAKPGDWITVIGVGGLGQLAIQYASAMGYKVAAVDVSDDKIKLAKKSGAKIGVNATKEDPVKFMQEKLNGGPQAVVNTAVAPIAFEQGFKMLKNGGREVLVGLPANDELKISIFWTVLQGKEIVGSIVGTRQDLKEALDYAANGEVKSEITKVVKLDQVSDIFEKLEKGTFLGRAVIDFNKK